MITYMTNKLTSNTGSDSSSLSFLLEKEDNALENIISDKLRELSQSDGGRSDEYGTTFKSESDVSSHVKMTLGLNDDAIHRIKLAG